MMSGYLEGRLWRFLALSLSLHAGVWALSPEHSERLSLSERFSAALSEPQVVTIDRFTEVPPPVVEVKKEAGASEVAPTEPAPQREVKRKVRRKVRRKVKRKVRRKVRRSAKHTAKPSASREVKREVTAPSKLITPTPAPLSAPSAPVSASSSVVAQSAPQAASSSSQVETGETRETGEVGEGEVRVQRTLSREALLGLQRGYLSSLNALMKRERSYPRSARRLGLEGTVLVELIVDAKGNVRSAKVVRSSGHESLDEAALADVRKMKQVPHPPKALKKRALKLRIPFEYRLQS